MYNKIFNILENHQLINYRLISCGIENIRFWRIREQSLRSCPVNLKDYHNEEFTDIVFADEFNMSQNATDRRL